jgi:divalent metal cation (Fe/Co/Zn/Cd) transporter
VRFSGLYIIDSVIAVGVAIYILKLAIDTIRKPMSGLLDEKLPPPQQAAIEASLSKHCREVSGFHALRTRRAGNWSYVDLHLVMARDITLEQAHRICNQVEAEIRNALREASVVIHAEPCEGECKQCSAVCSTRRTN